MKFISRTKSLKKQMTFFSLINFYFSFPKRKISWIRFKKMLNSDLSLEQRFTSIWRDNIWDSKESRSGLGSSLEYTSSVRQELPTIFRKFGVRDFFDGPCGDFHWMNKVDLSGLNYIGGDIVQPLIDELNLKYSSARIKFIHHDLTRDSIPRSDLVLNRDCLFHLSYSDILLFFTLFLESKSKYLLTTSHENFGLFENKDISSGDFRYLDLFANPFEFSSNFHFMVSEPESAGIPARGIFLWDNLQVAAAQRNLDRYLKKF